jgi:hypothetical protein
MKARMWNDPWMDDGYDATDKKVDVWYWKNDNWNNMHVSITTDDGHIQTDENGKWVKPIISVNMKQLRERVNEFLHADLPCFDDIEPTAFLITMRDSFEDMNLVELAQWW